MGEVVAAEMVRYTVLIPYERGDLVELFHRRGHVTHQASEETGTQLSGTLPRQIVPIFAPYRVQVGGGAERTRTRTRRRMVTPADGVPPVSPAELAGSSGRRGGG